MTQPLTNHVFMSYSRKDETVMRRIVVFLRKRGINVWVDNERLVPGTPIWEAEIEKAIISAGAVVVLLSPDSKDSPWVRREISYAEDNDKRIFPVFVAGNPRDTIPIRLTNHQRIDIRENEEVGLNSLTAALSFYLEDLEARERKAREEAEKMARAKAGRLAKQKAEEERLAEEKIESERKAKEDAKRIAKARPGVNRIAEEKRSAMSKTKTEELDNQEAKEESIAKTKITEELRAQEKRLTTEKIETERKAKERVKKIPPWLGRIILGATLGTILSIGGSLANENFNIFAGVVIVCGFTGLITHPHKLSIVILTLSFLAVGILYNLIFDIRIYVFEEFFWSGVVLGLPTGGLISRVLYWVKVIN